MPRRVQDIVPSRRSIRSVAVDRPKTDEVRPKKLAPAEDIRKPSAIKAEMKKVEKKAEDTTWLRRMPFTPPAPPVKKKRARRKGMWKLFVALGAVIVIVAVAFIASTYFSHATFKLVPKKIPVTVDNTYVAENVAGANTLGYEISILRGSASSTVPAVSGATVSTRATGKVTIYNSYGTTAQRLVAGTRVSNDTGRIYKLSGSVVVPGYTLSGSTKTPGSVSATIIADQPGETYNIYRSDAQSDFRFLGYKGSPKYDAFYARATGDIAGGFSGAKKTVASPVMASTTLKLQSEIAAALLGKAKSMVAEDRIMYDNSYVITFAPPAVSGSDPATAVVAVQGTLSAITFKRSALMQRIIGDKATDAFPGAEYTSPGLESLILTIANPKDFSPEKKNTLIIKLKGMIDLIGTIPVDIIKSEVAGMKLADTEKVLQRHTSVVDIAKSGAEVVPPWSRVPTDPKRITVVVQGK